MKERVKNLVWSVTLGLGLLTGCDEQKPATLSAPVQPKPVIVQIPVPPVLTAALPEASSKKLSAPLIKAVEVSQQPRVAGQTVPRLPDISVQDGNLVLVEIEGRITKDLIDHITGIGGRSSSLPESGKPLRAFIPMAQLGAVAERADVTAISAAEISVTDGMRAAPPAPTPSPVPGR